MQSKNWLALVTVVVFATSCGESSTKNEPTTEPVTTMDNKMPERTQVVNTIVVPESTRLSFERQYPKGDNATWSSYEPVTSFDWGWSGWPSMDTTDYMVKYSMDNSDYWTWYDNDNNWIGTVSAVTDFAGLPQAVNNSIQSNFPGYKIVSVDKENDKNRTAYELELTKGDDKMKALVAENGDVLKKKGIIAGEKIKEKTM
jgi:hypothetical protein